MSLRAIALVSALCISSTAVAWGPEGHAIVADIAEAHLTSTALGTVKILLAVEDYSHLDDISSWADQNRVQHPETGPWHYVDIPLAIPSYNPERDCPQSACIVSKISEFARQLANKTADQQTRLTALKWLVHFIGDIHQPLHAEDHADKGGNDIKLSYFGKSTNLHRIWDGAILEHALNLQLGPNYSFDHDAVRQIATQINELITTEERTFWLSHYRLADIDQQSIAWAEESHHFAPIAYNYLPANRQGNWYPLYQAAAWPVIGKQLQKGGIRLAGILNEALR